MLGPLFQKKSSSTMKEELDEVVELGLSDKCLRVSDSNYFQFFAFRLCPHSKRVTNARVQEDGCSSSPTTRNVRQSAVQSNRFIFYFWANFP